MTDCERLLRVLNDGKPHGHAELYRLGMIVHSRVADLRKQGYLIDCRCVGRVGGRALYEYQLLGAAASESGAALPDPSVVPDSQLALALPGSSLKKARAA